jgi:hypothetical protein
MAHIAGTLHIEWSSFKSCIFPYILVSVSPTRSPSIVDLESVDGREGCSSAGTSKKDVLGHYKHLD